MSDKAYVWFLTGETKSPLWAQGRTVVSDILSSELETSLPELPEWCLASVAPDLTADAFRLRVLDLRTDPITLHCAFIWSTRTDGMTVTIRDLVRSMNDKLDVILKRLGIEK